MSHYFINYWIKWYVANRYTLIDCYIPLIVNISWYIINASIISLQQSCMDSFKNYLKGIDSEIEGDEHNYNAYCINTLYEGNISL